MTLKEFNNNYIYKKDIDKFNKKDILEVIVSDYTGKYYGDRREYDR